LQRASPTPPAGPRAARRRPGAIRRDAVMRTPAATTKVLILARESVIAALLGMLLELEAYEPVYPEPDERYEDAIRRVRPPLVVVLDGESEEARSDLFFARAAHGGGARGAVQRARRRRRGARRRARAAAAVLRHAVDRATLGTVLQQLASA
jgi:hypothetical protein